MLDNKTEFGICFSVRLSVSLNKIGGSSTE